MVWLSRLLLTGAAIAMAAFRLLSKWPISGTGRDWCFGKGCATNFFSAWGEGARRADEGSRHEKAAGHPSSPHYVRHFSPRREDGTRGDSLRKKTLKSKLMKPGRVLGAALIMSVFGIAAVHAESESFEAAPPYKMVRALQLIQDQIVRGDRSANDMQKFLLTTIDQRLRNIDMAAFDDTRNVDAALIYAMSGGNPETLDLLAERDVAGNFDNRVTSIIRRYLKGRGETVIKQLQDVVPEYRNTLIGPYLELIGANAVMGKQPDVAIRFFDWARLESPGTIIEEAAIRRSLALMSKNGNIEKALYYAKLYARRFMVSPYATQFADIFVLMALDHTELVGEADIEEVLELMEQKRQREIYLRLARRAAINGNRQLATFSSGHATRLSGPDDNSPRALAELYSGLVNIPTDGVEKVLERLSAIEDKDLSPKDRFLKDAARVVAEEVSKPPTEESLTQVRRDMVEKEYRDVMAERIRNADPVKPGVRTVQSGDGEAMVDVENFVSAGRSRLKEIDALLTSESK